jgi:hypothetical protein
VHNRDSVPAAGGRRAVPVRVREHAAAARATAARAAQGGEVAGALAPFAGPD